MKAINPQELDLLEEKVVKINRVAKVVTGGRRFRFNAIVVVGDGRGHVGVGLGKAKEVSSAVQKGKEDAKKHIVKIPIINGTIPHEVYGKHGAGKVILKPASPGTGIIAGGPVRSIMVELGVHDILAKSLGSSNANNIINATMIALLKLKDPFQIARKRDLTLQEIFGT